MLAIKFMLKFRNHLGLDIGSKIIKLVQLVPESNSTFKLVAIGSAPTPYGGNNLETENVQIEAIKKLVKESRATVRQAVISLPESQVYTRVIEMPALLDEELPQAIKWQAEQYIPIPLSEAVLKYQVLSRQGEEEAEKKMKVLLIAAPNSVLNSYLSLLSRAGLEVIAIETEILAVVRALIGTDPFSPDTLLVHLGNEAVTIAVLKRGELTLTQSISSGGAALTRAIASSLGLEESQAEEYKCAYGLDDSRVEGKVAMAIRPIVEMIFGEIKRSLAFYESHDPQKTIKRVVLSGGAAFLPGLVSYFTANLDVEVQTGDPFLTVNLTDKQRAEIGENRAIYSTAVGLAMKPT